MIRDRSNPVGWTSAVLGPYKLLDTPTGLELYIVRADPGEHANLIRAHPPIYDALRKLLVEHQALAKRSPIPKISHTKSVWTSRYARRSRFSHTTNDHTQTTKTPKQTQPTNNEKTRSS